MFPVLLRFPMPWGDPDTYFPVRMFGLLVILAFLAGAWLVARRGRDAPTPRTSAFDLCFHLLAAGLVGSRALYVAQHVERFEGRWLQVIAIWEQGLVWWGGFALAVAVVAVWARAQRRPFLTVTDSIVPGLALALAIGWIGSYCAGDHHGVHVTDGSGEWVSAAEDAPAYAVQYPGPDAGWRYEYSETPADFRAPYYIVPTQLIASLAHLSLLVLVLLLAARARAQRRGRLTGVFLVVHSTALFALEPLRGDVERVRDVLGTPLTFTQACAIPVALAGLWLSLRPPRPLGDDGGKPEVVREEQAVDSE